MAIKFPSGGIVCGSNQADPFGQFNKYSHLLDSPVGNLKCAFCSRVHGRPRKNKLLWDEQRGIELATGHVTIIKKQELEILSEHQGSKKMELLMCNECITRIDILETAWIFDDRKGSTRIKYIENWRFKRKNEETHSRFLRVELHNPHHPQIGWINTNSTEHYTDFLDINRWQMLEKLKVVMAPPTILELEQKMTTTFDPYSSLRRMGMSMKFPNILSDKI
jgi:hypothetical protein